MKAMIFAAGLGTRLKPLTDNIPKALVPVSGKPLLQHTVEKLKAAGFDEIMINVHHFADRIIDFVATNHYFGIHIEFSDEREKLLDTGGGIKKAARFFDDDKPFLVHNVDILSNINLLELYEAHTGNKLINPIPIPALPPVPSPISPMISHPVPPTILPLSPQSRMDVSSDTNTLFRQKNPLATLVCSKRKTTRYLLFDNDNRLKGWINEKTGEVKSPFPDFNPLHHRKLAFAGIQILQPSIFNYMTGLPDRFSSIDFYLSICHKEKLVCFTPDHLKLIDVGKPESLKEAARFLGEHP